MRAVVLRSVRKAGAWPLISSRDHLGAFASCLWQEAPQEESSSFSLANADIPGHRSCTLCVDEHTRNVVLPPWAARGPLLLNLCNLKTVVALTCAHASIQLCHAILFQRCWPQHWQFVVQVLVPGLGAARRKGMRREVLPCSLVVHCSLQQLHTRFCGHKIQVHDQRVCVFVCVCDKYV